MRPQEILGMMEEAAGTRMFEDRKEKAKRTMGKKDLKVKEIKAVSIHTSPCVALSCSCRLPTLSDAL
jgi:hypothetical protein